MPVLQADPLQWVQSHKFSPWKKTCNRGNFSEIYHQFPCDLSGINWWDAGDLQTWWPANVIVSLKSRLMCNGLQLVKTLIRHRTAFPSFPSSGVSKRSWQAGGSISFLGSVGGDDLLGDHWVIERCGVFRKVPRMAWFEAWFEYPLWLAHNCFI